ncbi:hypothetical protein PVK06_043584 [Gossypium arboreum]|uniref:Uncharacterized protein n=1 Tax=Gossypium arboreum TaxID=29729 RepID=A0ABR0MNT6_GOSAR|nr:hypothetical protein PVK06_043584 [Gossypium arboreum]
MTETVSDPMDIESDITVNVVADIKVRVTTNMKLKLILNGGVKEPIHLLAIAEKVSAEETDEFDSFSSYKANKAQVTKNLHDMERRKLEAIIP